MKKFKEGIDMLKGNTLEINIPENLNLTSVKIGNQTWMRRNLNVTKFRNGEHIPEASSISEMNVSTPMCSCYDFNHGNAKKYGRLYNRAAITDERGLAPVGWRIPKIIDWERLKKFLGENCGGKLKQKGTLNWSSPNTGATNETHFTALPGGHFGFDEEFNGLGYDGVWSCIDLYESGDWEPLNYVVQTWLHYKKDSLDFNFNGTPERFCSVRCIRSAHEIAEKKQVL